MKQEIIEGLSFGLTSSIITTLGLLIGLTSTTQNRIIAISAILTIALADSMSDALGVHISQESDKKNKESSIWNATYATFFTKLIVTSTFIIPILTLKLNIAIIVSVIYGLLLLSIFSYYISKNRKEPPLKSICEHLAIGVTVIIITKVLGSYLHSFI